MLDCICYMDSRTTMSTIVIEHVALNELPAAWRKQLAAAPDARVTIRIEEEVAPLPRSAAANDNPLFGMWQDRTDITDVDDYLRKLRSPRYLQDATRNDE